MKKKNNKGMTLVEIVIVLLIASIAMTITGGILVNSLGYFDDNTKNSIDKQTADGVLDFINSEIKYSTLVTMTNSYSSKPESSKKDGWHCLYIDKHRDDNNNQTDDLVL